MIRRFGISPVLHYFSAVFHFVHCLSEVSSSSENTILSRINWGWFSATDTERRNAVSIDRPLASRAPLFAETLSVQLLGKTDSSTLPRGTSYVALSTVVMCSLFRSAGYRSTVRALENANGGYFYNSRCVTSRSVTSN